MIFEVTSELINEKANELGIDIENLDEDEYKCELVENEAVKMSKKYGFEIIDWIKDNGIEINEIAEKIIVINEEEIIKLKDAVEVTQWYSLFISAKVHRVFMDYCHDDDFEYDRLGSSKIAIIAIERSISALAYLLENLSGHEDVFTKIPVKFVKNKKRFANSISKNNGF
jgi:hypothetical protein